MEKNEQMTPPRSRGMTWARRVGRLFLAGVAILLASAGALLIWAATTAPDIQLGDAAPDGYRTTVLDDQGTVMLTLAGEASNRVYVPLEEMPQALRDAFVAIEDQRFYEHSGVDLRGMARALWHNAATGTLSQGASTITQQLIKNNVLTGWTEEKTALDKIRRKLQEQYLALRLEREASKDWILENYLNTINLGGGAWGVETAAQRYFGKSAAQLTLSECAVLAGTAKSPNGCSPAANPEASRQRQVLVLEKMLDLEYITEEAYQEALADDVYQRILPAGPGGRAFSYFEDALVRQIVEDLVNQRGYTEEAAWDMLYRGGLTIISTQSTSLQSLCEAEVNRDSWYTSDAQASLVLMDPYTGQIKAVVGGRGKKTASLTFNRALSSLRQPGSTIKVVGAYAAALNAGSVTLASVYDDAPCTYSDGTPVRNAGGTFSGRITVRQAIAQSVNTVALQCFQQVGMEAVWTCLQNFGFSHLTEEDRVEALALGGTYGGVTSLELTAAYAAIANGGTYRRPQFYTQVLDQEGAVLLDAPQEERSVLQPGAAALLTDAMEDVLQTGTGSLAAFSGMPLAGKSGTTTDLRDVWFVGYSPYYVCGVWGGYDDCSTQRSGAYVKKIWRAVMEAAHQDLPFRDFSHLSEFIRRTICTKCGFLAVEGLCDSTVQGDMTREEDFLPGTEPTEYCTCHVRVALCGDSGAPAGRYCPAGVVKEGVYLAQGTAGTADAEAAAPEWDEEQTCPVHRRWWNWFFPDRSGREEQSHRVFSGGKKQPAEEP